MMDRKALCIQVRGRVQGVGFRYHTRATAQRLGVKGFVKNKADGSVCIEVEGDGLSVDLFWEWCRKGPDWAEVTEIKVHELPVGGFDEFLIH